MITHLRASIEQNADIQFDTKSLLHEKDYEVILNDAYCQDLDRLMKVTTWKNWFDLQGSLMYSFNASRTQFIQKFQVWVKWHIQVVQEQNNMVYNEYFET